MEHREPADPSAKEPQATSKKPYSTPVLKVHGDVDELTKLLGGGPSDGVMGSGL